MVPSDLLSLLSLYLSSILYCLALSDDSDLLFALQQTANEICPSRSRTCGNISWNYSPCCGYCDCGPNCIKHGSCCLTEYTSLAHARDTVRNSRYGCVKPQYLRSKSDTDFISTVEDDAVWMIRKCKPTATKIEREQCENPELSGSVASLVPVYYFGKHYRNRFCAYCNDISQKSFLTDWRLEIICNEPLLHFLTEETFLQTIKENRCNIFFKTPYIEGTRKPFTEMCKEQIYTISKCNVTGLWSAYNETTDIACDSFVDAFNMTYKNYFCWLCNTNGHLPKDRWKCRDPDMGAGASINPPFVAILDLSAVKTKDENTEELKCDEDNQFEDRKMMKCRDILCDSKSYLEDGQCHSENSSNSDAKCYKIFVKLSPIPDRLFLFQDVTGRVFQSELQYLLRELLKDINNFLEEFGLFAKRRGMPTNQIYVVIQMKFYIPDLQKTNILSHLIGILDQKSLVIDMNDNNVTFVSRIVAYNLGLFDDPSKFIITVPNDDASSFDTIEHVPIHEYNLGFPWLRCNGFFPFSKLDVCPFIELDRSDLQFQIVNGFVVINETFLFKILNPWEFKYGSNRLSLCIADYETIYGAMPRKIAESENYELAYGAKETFSLVCVCLSILCLLVTIVIYVTLTELHSQPGINTIILCVALLLAQSIYQFGAGQTDGPEWSCTVIGACCHFLWLTVMFAMNVCSFDMFRIFKTIQKLSTDFNWKETMKRLAYIVFASLLFVVINFVVSVFLSNGEDFGYGGVICYLSSTRMHLITFIMPSLFTIIINFALFCYVVIQIGQTRVHAAKLGHERSYFGIYVRLSTLTGLTWLFGFLRVLMKNEVLEYQFILLNAGQGVFIMFAFVCNRRVYRLIRDKLSARMSSQTQRTRSD